MIYGVLKIATDLHWCLIYSAVLVDLTSFLNVFKKDGVNHPEGRPCFFRILTSLMISSLNRQVRMDDLLWNSVLNPLANSSDNESAGYLDHFAFAQLLWTGTALKVTNHTDFYSIFHLLTLPMFTVISQIPGQLSPRASVSHCIRHREGRISEKPTE